MTKDKLLVCLPTYNRAELLRSTLADLLAQSLTDFRIFVFDNNSTDATAEVVAGFGPGRVRYFGNTSNLGMTENWNRALSEGLREDVEYIAFYHDDDLYAKDILRTEVTFLDHHPECGLVHAAAIFWNTATGRKIPRIPYPTDRVFSLSGMLSELCDRGIYHITTPSVMLRKEAVLKAGLFDADFRICPDLDLWWRILEHSDLGYVSTPLITVRIHGGQTSASGPAHQNAITQRETFKVFENILKRRIASGAISDDRELREGMFRYGFREIARSILLKLGTLSQADVVSIRLQLSNLDHRGLAGFVTLFLLLMNNAAGAAFIKALLWGRIKGSRFFQAVGEKAG